MSLHREQPTGSPCNVSPGTVREITTVGTRLRILVTSDQAADLIVEITPTGRRRPRRRHRYLGQPPGHRDHPRRTLTTTAGARPQLLRTFPGLEVDGDEALARIDDFVEGLGFSSGRF
ncbi:hypothetical protein [Streptomyces sp. AP-93]|uniref:hypothetical protein n=1 Tax=Streptomyces sp. AP-93 TaxID=2929048 RepID=UPI0035B0BDDF